MKDFIMWMIIDVLNIGIIVTLALIVGGIYVIAYIPYYPLVVFLSIVWIILMFYLFVKFFGKWTYFDFFGK
ncbi:hypothetical protein [Trabulsiella guamensis]|uniref:hypothetical protein n=1 Tax=Trabulsiella guamensis TaxID=158852 RepID=UPI00056FCB23|nr:hypothetical protein [Trabulsiella guamensis]